MSRLIVIDLPPGGVLLLLGCYAGRRGAPTCELRDNAVDQIHSQAQKAISLPSLFNGMMGMKLWAGSQCRSQ
jgi:hypothetical protein